MAGGTPFGALLRPKRAQQSAERLAAGPAYSDNGYVIADELGRPSYPDFLSDRYDKLTVAAALRRLHDFTTSRLPAYGRKSHACLECSGEGCLGAPGTLVANDHAVDLRAHTAWDGAGSRSGTKRIVAWLKQSLSTGNALTTPTVKVDRSRMLTQDLRQRTPVDVGTTFRRSS